MTVRVGFDNEKYLEEQTTAIRERVRRLDSKLYLEFGGKIIFDYHASRVLPGVEPNVKMRLLQSSRTKPTWSFASTPVTSSAARCVPTSASPTTPMP